MNRLSAERSVLWLVDWQDRPWRAQPDPHRTAATTRTQALLWAAKRLEIPIIVTEIAPRTQGRTISSLSHPRPFSRTRFPASESEEIVAHLKELGRDTMVLTGLETQINVLQTAEGLRTLDYTVDVVADATLASTQLDWSVGLERVREAGAGVVTTDLVLFAWVPDTRTPLYNELCRQIR